jgi:hypothetical protein
LLGGWGRGEMSKEGEFCESSVREWQVWAKMEKRRPMDLI